MVSIVEIAVFTVDAIVLPILFYSYNKVTKKLKNIENVKVIDLADLKSNKSLDKITEYALINGEVQPKNIDITSNYNKQHSGVIKVISIKKHATSWRNNPFGEDYSKDLSSSVSAEPFYIVNKKSKIEIINGDKADYLLKELETTHKQYDSSDSNILSTITSLVFSKDVTNGIEITEKMLKNGTFLWGIQAYGRLEKMSDNSFYLSRPLNSDFPYILTKQDRQNVIGDMKDNISVLKFFLFLFGSIGVVTGGYWLFRYYKIYKEKRQRERMTQSLREERLRLDRERVQNNQVVDNQNIYNPEQTCVLCLVNPREIILLDCGHYCLCIDCVDRLPNQNCPICRREFQSFHRCYVP